MLIGLKEILKLAEARKCAVGAFNTPNLASIRAVLAAAERLNEPVILMHAQVHEEMGLCKMDEIAPIMLLMADKAAVPVCVHLDHGTDLCYIKRGLDLGFCSVMYDGSELPNELNYANTAIVVEMARRRGAPVETENGAIGARESGGDNGESNNTDPEVTGAFVRKTGIDALACAFGTAHGIYLRQPKLDFARLNEIKNRVDVPLVMHGGSGVKCEDYKKVIGLGIRKINYYTYMAKAGGTAAAALADKTFYHDIEAAAIQAMTEDVAEAIKIFSL